MKNSHPELKEIRIVSEDTLGERQVFHLVFTSLGRVFQYVGEDGLRGDEDPAVKTMYMGYRDALDYYYEPTAIRHNFLQELQNLFRPSGRDEPIEFHGMGSLFGWGKNDGHF